MGIDFEPLKAEQAMQDTDDFNFICYVAFSHKPLTRAQRAENVRAVISSASTAARLVKSLKLS